ncbi:MAG: serine hydrolase [Candidatus Izemoplasmatales bacterium]|nr:serine hydrolase [Candidatus Izemoplasmatales bacterium]
MKKFIEQIKGGTLFIKNKDKELFFCTGYRDLTNEIITDKETSFPTASAGKFFVAVGIMKLIENKQLSLDTTIGELLSFELHLIDKDITIKQLLTHTSGIPNYFDEKIMSDYSQLWKDFPNYKIRTSKDLLPLFIDKEMQYPRGERFSYNDSGFVILGIIIEEITKKPFDEYLDEIIFKPLTMNSTGYYELDRLPKNCANAYIFDQEKNEYYQNIYSVDVKGTGAGGAFTNVIDVSKFWDGILNYKILKKETVDLMLKRHADLNDVGYGLGVWLDEQNNPFFTGEDPGVTFISWCNPKDEKIITIISNYRDNIFSIFKEIKSLGI